jgi:hypothetical protein
VAAAKHWLPFILKKLQVERSANVCNYLAAAAGLYAVKNKPLARGASNVKTALVCEAAYTVDRLVMLSYVIAFSKNLV